MKKVNRKNYTRRKNRRYKKTHSKRKTRVKNRKSNRRRKRTMRGGSASGTDKLELPAQITYGNENTSFDFILCKFEFNQNRLTKVKTKHAKHVLIDVGNQKYVAHDPKRARPGGRWISIEFPLNIGEQLRVRKIVVNAGDQYERVKRLLGEVNWKS